MASSALVKEGTLSLRQKGNIIKKTKQCHAKLFRDSSSGVARLEIYENEKASVNSQHLLIITGHDVIKVEQMSGQSTEERHTILVATRDQKHTFFCADVHSCNEWVKAIQGAIFPKGSSSPYSQAVMTKNEIYESFNEDSVITDFMVKVADESRNKLTVNETVRLVVENGNITVITLQGNRLVRWTLESIREYGYTTATLMLVVGRSGKEWQGNFVFETKQGELIKQAITKEKKLLTKGIKGPQLPPGQVVPPSNLDLSSLTFDGSIYEEVPMLISPSPHTAIPDDAQKGKERVHSGGTNTPLAPTSRSEKQPPIPTNNPNLKPSSNYPNALAGMPSVKSAPTNPRTASSTVNASSFQYSLPELKENAWMSHGIGDDDDYQNASAIRSVSTGGVHVDSESDYDTLNYSTHQDDMNNWRTTQQRASSHHHHQQLSPEPLYSEAIIASRPHHSSHPPQQLAQPTEPIYAMVNKMAKRPKNPKHQQQHQESEKPTTEQIYTQVVCPYPAKQ